MGPLDRNSPVPLYHQFEQELLHRIQSGEFEAGDVFPTERELEESYRVSRITVRRALSELALGGFISRQAGRGTFVLPRKIEHRFGGVGGIRDDLIAYGVETESRILRHEVRPVPCHVAKKLGLKEGQSILYVKRLFYADGEPLLMTRGYHNFGKGITFTSEELESDSVFKLLQDKYGFALSRVERVIEATLALDDEAELLGIRLKSPVLLAELMIYDKENQPISFMKNIYRGDRYKYHQTVEM